MPWLLAYTPPTNALYPTPTTGANAPGTLTQSSVAWGISELKVAEEHLQVGKFTFKMPANVDAPSPFAQWGQIVLIKQTGEQLTTWFVGIIAEQPRAQGPKAENLLYEVHNPAWFLTKTVFQQMWVTLAPNSGAGVETMTTTRSVVILGQSLSGVQMDLGDVLREVLYYCVYAAQMIPFPATVDVNNLPPAPNFALGPFQVGQITPDITVPFTQLNGKSCLEIIEYLLKWVPDAVLWFDYSTTPPTLNIAQRGGLQVNTLSVLDGPANGGFNPRPRYDLQPPVVVAKYTQHNTIDGTSYDLMTVDSYPPAPPGVDQGAWESQPRALVMTVDLLGGNETFTHQPITVADCPVNWADANAMNWVLQKDAWLIGPDPAHPVYDVNHILVNDLETTLDPNDPQAITPDPNFPGLDAMTEELITGTVQSWMKTNDFIYAVKVLKAVTLVYQGTDPATMALFTYNPLAPNIPTQPGQGFFMRYYPVTVTNASSQTYDELTSLQASEPQPVGLAQTIYDGLQQLHFDGDLTLVEDECTDALPMGTTFNTTDGLPAWQAMNALVLSTSEDIDHGLTKVRFGPPFTLSLDDWVQLLRAARGIIPTWKLQQRTTGLATGNAQVMGAEHTPAGNTGSPAPPQLPLQVFPFQVIWQFNPSDPSGNTFQAMVQLNSNLWTTLNTTTPITGLDTWFNLNPNDTIWLLASVANLAVTPGTPTIHSYGMGNNDYNAGAAIWSAGSALENDGTAPPNGPNQTLFRKVIAISTADAKGRPQIQQQFSGDLLMTLSQVNGIPCLIPT